jgi:hypothetical protein
MSALWTYRNLRVSLTFDDDIPLVVHGREIGKQLSAALSRHGVGNDRAQRVYEVEHDANRDVERRDVVIKSQRTISPITKSPSIVLQEVG